MEVSIKLSTEQAQQILNSLIKEPYIEVVELIESIQNQAAEQLQLEDEGDISSNIKSQKV